MVKRFRAILEGVDNSSGTFVRVPDSVMKAFDGRIRVPLRISLDGVEHRTTICDMGRGPSIGIPAAVRRAARIERGDRITLALEVDQDERTVDVPPDFAKAMTAVERRAYDGIAKKPETRARRIGHAREKLRERACR
ncbi:MAG: YdeI/OmpD-associated family protein [Candidatus Cybelea sp.]